MSEVTGQGERVIVDHLADSLARWLGDRDGTRHAPPWEPRQYVVLGVLPATISPPAPATTDPDGGGAGPQESPEQTIEASAVEVLGADDTALPAMALTFLVATTENRIKLAVELDFALYVEEYPTVQEQRDYVGHLATATEASQVSDESSDSESGPAGRVPPSSGSADAESAAAAHRHRRQTNVGGAWRRLNIHVDDFLLDLHTTEEHITVDAPIAECVRAAVTGHFSGEMAARPFRTRTRTISLDDLASEDQYRHALQEREDPAFEPLYPNLKVTGFVQRIGGGYLVSVSFTNATFLPRRQFQDLSAYDCRMRVYPQSPAALLSQRFELAPRDYRYMDDVSLICGQGNACVAEPLPGGGVGTTTLPRFYQHAVLHRADHVPPLAWDDLAADPDPVLDGVESAMQMYLDEWDAFLRGVRDDVRPESMREREAFASEVERFQLGREAMRGDPRLAQAFRMANAVFGETNAAKGYDQWRLFQLVYIVSQLPALAAREHRDVAEFVREVEFADVLWIPTGGGKTEAYLGLLVIALFYDRLRGKTRGVTAWLKFPLRMLSVQQLARVLRVLVTAERHRAAVMPGSGAPFELGYLVGSSNTPNQLRYPAGEWWPGFAVAKDSPAGLLDERRLVAECPYCGEDRVGLDVDADAVRIKHVCRACGKTLPIYMSDEEVYRYLPSVLVGTVDKLTGFAFFGEFTQFTHGARWPGVRRSHVSMLSSDSELL